MKSLLPLFSLSVSLFAATPELFDSSYAPATTFHPKDSLLSPQIPYKSTGLAVGLSSLVPGLGHVYLDDAKTAGSLFGTTALGLGIAFSPEFDYTTRGSCAVTAVNIWSYGIYAAYRDARNYNIGEVYTYKMPTDSFSDLTYAPFTFAILKKPEVWGGFLGSMAVGMTIGYLAFGQGSEESVLSTSGVLAPITAFPIGIGEEALFRGYLQSVLSEALNPVAGIALSSLAFGAAHIWNADALPKNDRWRYYSFILPFLSASGAYMGWMTHKNHSLQPSVALHSWYDFTLFAIRAVATESISTGRPSFAMEFSF